MKSLKLIANPSVSIKEGYSGYVDFSGAGIKGKGNSIDFLVKFLGYSVDEAVNSLCSDVSPTAVINGNENKKREFAVPLMAENNDKILWYLTNRGFSRSTLDMLINKNLLYQENRGENVNCIFLSERCDYGERRGADLGNNFKGIIAGSRPDGFWHVRNNYDKAPEVVFITESAIDAVSLYELYNIAGQNKSAVFASIGGAGKQQAINRLVKSGREIYICTDNDKAGHDCRERNSNLNTLVPVKKDWNDDLCEKNKELMKKNDICRYNYLNICNKHNEYVEIGCCNKNCDDYRKV